jgi:hypothetical protein
MVKQEELPYPYGWQNYTDTYGNNFDLRLTTDNDAQFAAVKRALGSGDRDSTGVFSDPYGQSWNTDGYDNDGDGTADESGEGCASWATDGIDNDGDGNIDSADLDELLAANGLDDDGDLVIDDEHEGCYNWSEDGLDNDDDGWIDESDEEVSHVGWYFDLPGYGSKNAPANVRKGERVIEDVVIRGTVAIVVTSAPIDTACSGDGESMLMEMNAYTGSRLLQAQIDINGDGRVDENDLVPIVDIHGNIIFVPPTGVSQAGIVQAPTVLETDKGPEPKIFSNSAGETPTVDERNAANTLKSWRELSAQEAP